MRRLPILATTIVLVAVAAMIGLGVWQLQRARWKEGLIARYAEADKLPALALAGPPDARDPPLFRRATAHCLKVVEWGAKAGRNARGASGWSHIARCRTGAEGPGLSVDIGWSRDPRAPKWRGGDLSGQLAPDTQHIYRLVATTPGPGLEPSAPPNLSDVPNNHRSYAVQWFVFAGVAGLIYLLALRGRRATPWPGSSPGSLGRGSGVAPLHLRLHLPRALLRPLISNDISIRRISRMTAVGQDTLGTRTTLELGGQEYAYYSLAKAAEQLGDISRLPFSMKVLLENLLRFEDGVTVTVEDLKAMVAWQNDTTATREIQYRPARVLMQDFTGVPCVVDLAAMRDAMNALGGDAEKINPQVPVHLVIDHSVMVDAFGTPTAIEDNMTLEYARNGERYEFLKWGSESLDNFKVVPPGTGICHQVNLEHIAKGVWTSTDPSGATIAYPDTCVGTDSHTTMINGLGVLGWGVGGIEAEAAMLGQPVSMLIPEVVGFRLTGSLNEGVTATDLVLTVTQMLRAKGVVGRFVEFYGPGLNAMTLADRATIANMAPEYGATCGFFPIDDKTTDYMRLTGREEGEIALVEAYCRAQGLWRDTTCEDPVFTDTLELDLVSVEPSLAGPKRPQDKVFLTDVDEVFNADLIATYKHETPKRAPVAERGHDVGDGDVVIAAITSCTNTSNPSVLVAAGLVAKKANEFGLRPKPWVKTSLAPGSQVVTDYLTKSGLQAELDQVGFNLVGYGCTTCIGNSGPLAEAISNAINENDIVVASVLSGNRNFEGRVSPDVRANFLASPPLVVAYALKGTVTEDITLQPIGEGKDGPVYLKDIWPSNAEVRAVMDANVDRSMFAARKATVFTGDERWQSIDVEASDTYNWRAGSTYVANPPYFEGMSMTPAPITDIVEARPLAIFGDSITTDHISPAGSIKANSPAGSWLQEHQVSRADFNSYGARRGHHEVMMRGTFANIRIRNEMIPGVEGGMTSYKGEVMPIYDAAMRYKADGTPLVVIAGKEYGTGSSRDWAAKGTNLLGVRAVIAESFERIHRSNLVGMGVLPLQFLPGMDRKTLALDGSESFAITGVAALRPRQDVTVTLTRGDGRVEAFDARCRIDTVNELDYFLNGGILPYVLRKLAA